MQRITLANSRSFREVVSFRESPSQTFLKRNLLIFKALILDSRVDDGMLSWAAAPRGPEMRPAVAARTDSMASRSCAGDILVTGLSWRRGRESKESQLGSTEKTLVSQRITDRSITFCSSRIFPGQA